MIPRTRHAGGRAGAEERAAAPRLAGVEGAAGRAAGRRGGEGGGERGQQAHAEQQEEDGGVHTRERHGCFLGSVLW